MRKQLGVLVVMALSSVRFTHHRGEKARSSARKMFVLETRRENVSSAAQREPLGEGKRSRGRNAGDDCQGADSHFIDSRHINPRVKTAAIRRRFFFFSREDTAGNKKGLQLDPAARRSLC